MRRDKIEIILDILSVCRGGVKLTKVLRIANLQYNSFNRFMHPLISAKFIRRSPLETKDGRTLYRYETTVEGNDYMKKISKMLVQVRV